jgi:hypothetical protein
MFPLIGLWSMGGNPFMAENKIEQFLIDLKYTYRELNGFWLIEDPEHSLDGVAVDYTAPLVTIRVQVMDVPSAKREEFYAKLLELNAMDMIHGAYGIDRGKVVLVDTLEYDTMDFGEFRASLDAVSFALTQHYPILSVYRH